MPKLTSSSTWGWWLAGAFVALAIIIPHYLPWGDQRARTPPAQKINQAANKPTDNEAAQASAGINSTSLQATTAQPRETGRYGVEIRPGDFHPVTIDPEEIYWALMSADPTQRDEALETVSRFPDALYAFNAVYKRIVELSADNDRQLAKRARSARSQLLALRTRHEIPEPAESDVADTGQHDAATTGSGEVLEGAVEPFEALRERALDDLDPAVRMGGIEAAISQRDEQIVDVLSQAARNDYDPDNRMTAVSELEQMLKTGLGNRDQILRFLEETAADSDSRVAELSQLIIQEQFGQGEGFAPDGIAPSAP